jgi:hypothetical protein
MRRDFVAIAILLFTSSAHLALVDAQTPHVDPFVSSLLSPWMAYQQTPDKKQHAETIKKILSDPTIWGKDFGVALETIPYLERTGEREVLVFNNKVMGARKVEVGTSETRTAVRRINERIERSEQTSMMARSGTKAEALWFPEDNSQRVAVISSTSEYLAPKTTIDKLKERLGSPQKISKHVVDTAKEDRPEVFTYFHYADDSIIFVSSNIRNYGYIDRVILNTADVKAAMHK